jgi:outer membrane receptor protein involved in Fe transport
VTVTVPVSPTTDRRNAPPTPPDSPNGNGLLPMRTAGPRTDSAFLQFLGIGIGLTRNPGYARFDLAASYRVQKHLTLFLRAQNLLNRQYQDALGYPALGREILGGVKLRFGGE